MKLVWSFSDTPTPRLSEVGGKGFSLIRMSQAGLAVPGGFVLSVGFFEPWLAELQATAAWQDFVQAADDRLESCCNALKAAGAELDFTSTQQAAVDAALGGYPDSGLFAVRSSSPEEDLAGSSFAGGYETVLGVTAATLAVAVRCAFLSCLDVRVAIYKREHGFEVTNPRIAVVVQRQIASDVAGVGFSVNPINNSYDEAVYSSNWGLGETVVSGTASPDTYVVDKVNGKILTRELGRKETTLWLAPDGGTVERVDPRHDELTLTDEQVMALTEQLLRIEKLYGQPMDIEWAVADGDLFLLQARPITTVVPLAPALVTAPGERKRLYLDVTVSVQGLFEPLSVMGTSIIRRLFSAASHQVLGKDVTDDIDLSIFYVTEGRIYVNLSIILLLLGKERYCPAFAVMDPVAAAAVANVDEQEYKAAHYPDKTVILRLLNYLPDKAINFIESRFVPHHARRGCEKQINKFVQRLRQLAEQGGPLADFAAEATRSLAPLAFDELLPLMVAARRALSKMRAICEPIDGVDEQLEALDRSLPGNVTVEMGLALDHLAEHLRELEPQPTAEQLAQGVADKTLPPSFIEDWCEFLSTYGHRGPAELDVATPRYREQPGMLLDQIGQLSGLDDLNATPTAIYERSQLARQEAFEALSETVHEHYGWLQTKRFQSLYRVLESLGGLRESGKYYFIKIIDMIRSRAMAEAAALVTAGRLDRVQQVFDLSLTDLDRAKTETELDLRALAAENRRFSDRLRAAPELPRVIDSRGRIMRAPPPEPREGELVGQPVSTGVVRGPVKVLARPDEKPLLPGDILVARATDPGWTPLFVNAAAIVLEVGGLLQHGALVAREYGKPCVAGVEKATTQLTDGQIVEVDGAAGVIRQVDDLA